MFAFHSDIATSDVTIYRIMEFCFMCFTILSLIFSVFKGKVKGGIVFLAAYLTPFNRQMEIRCIPHIIRDERPGLFKNISATRINDIGRKVFSANTL
jgi:hypothetical protein